MARYRVRRDGEVAGVWRRAGEVIDLDAAQAQHLAPPFGIVVEPAGVEVDITAATARVGITITPLYGPAAPALSVGSVPPLRTRKGR